VQTAVSAHEESLRRAFAESLGGAASERFGLDAPMGAVTDQVIEATVLFSDIRNFTSLAERLNSSQEVAELLSVYFERTCEPVLKNGGRHLKFIGDGLMAVFSDTLSGSPLPAARRAVSAALAMALATHEFRSWLRSALPTAACRRLPLAWACTRAKSPVPPGHHPEQGNHPIGDTVNTAARLESVQQGAGLDRGGQQPCWPRLARACRPAA
jgi:serine/threonine-protein kinase PpkA